MLFVGEDGFHGHSDGRLQSARLLYHVAVHELPQSDARVRIRSKVVPRPPPPTADGATRGINAAAQSNAY